MVWIPLKNGSGQVVRGIKLRNPVDNLVYEVVGSKRKSINNYAINLLAPNQEPIIRSNHELRREEWTIEGDWLTPEQIASTYGRKHVDPDSNLPRPQRESFWRMQSKPGTFNYRQKKRLMKDPWYQERFGRYFDTTVIETVT